ncbi:hypothetical protein B0H16DRAFT_1558964 [Mycena metata]|uniref:Uncharacterized protein n=1 Tax=Mycena metata TaxID=1033252 RepID=A0AAD7IMH0_9AGAR|nr:hypothetical protein B0H16DRAFT_1558964 [Mycena metata]
MARGAGYVPRASRLEARIAPPTTSATPPSTVCGVLRVDKASGGTLGYISPTVNANGEFTLVAGQASGVVATIPNPLIQTANINIEVTTTNAPIWPYFGAFISPNVVESNNFGTAANTHALLGPTNLAPYGPSSAVGTAFHTFNAHYAESNVETAIWTLNAATGQFSVTWINDAPAATVVPARMMWSPTQKNLLITSRVTTANFNAAYGIDFVDVVMTFVQNP